MMPRTARSGCAIRRVPVPRRRGDGGRHESRRRGPGGGREPGDGLSLVAALWDRGLGGAPGAPVHAPAPAPAAQPRGGGGNPGRAPAQRRGAGHPRGAAGTPRLDGGKGAAAAGALAPPARPPAPPPSCATSAPSRGSCCTSTPRSWGASGTSASASPVTASSAVRAPAGSTCTWPSTTTRGWPMPRCGPVTARPTHWPSWSGRGPGSAPKASRYRR